MVVPMYASVESFSHWTNLREFFAEYVYYVYDHQYDYTGVRRFKRHTAVVEKSFPFFFPPTPRTI